MPGNPPAPKLITNFNELSDSLKGKLVKLTGVVFETPCEPYSLDYSATSNKIIDKQGNVIELRTSNYANFRGKGLPIDTGSIVGIYSIYGTTKQFAIRDLNDVIFDSLCPSSFVNMVNESFASGTLGVFKQFSVLGTDTWKYGEHSGKYYAQVTGYDSGTANEDWLISPSFNMDAYYDESLIFETATKYDNPSGTLKLFYSNDYIGTGSPVAANWTEITPINLSTGNFAWVSSGNINFSTISGNKVYFALTYTCTSTNIPTWEVTNIRLRGKKN